jgi:hypothetical protein
MIEFLFPFYKGSEIKYYLVYIVTILILTSHIFQAINV